LIPEILKNKGDTDFYRLLKMLREFQQTDDFSLRVQRKDEEQTGLIVFRPHELEETTAASAKETRKMLGLDPETREVDSVSQILSCSTKGCVDCKLRIIHQNRIHNLEVDSLT
jgi:hypothetical protein